MIMYDNTTLYLTLVIYDNEMNYEIKLMNSSHFI